MRHIIFCATLAALSIPAHAAWADDDQRDYQVTGVAELGFLAVLDHNVQFSRTGTDFDYDDQGGQDILFPVARLSMELRFSERHQLVFLYQPLELETRVALREDLVVDDLLFPKDTPMVLTYGFPFYRLSYLYDLADSPGNELSIGGSLQIRNADIRFASADGTLLRTNRDVGPVPLFKVRGRLAFGGGVFLGTEIDGIYAPVSYINGSDSEVTGALIDASLRAGVEVFDNASVFLNLRYLAGGAVGDSDDPGDEARGDGYVRNWLHFTTTTLGVSYTAF